ncbi:MULTISPECIES: hypothetical protein [Amycolatopsis]|uniref:Thioesterase domain-containing protein n=1 Tax=Amycolatopsis albidoflavus TaxID=102226 RepID=A0ABW5HX42_9PSEU
MTAGACWRQLSGSSGHLVPSVNFEAVRGTAGFADLAAAAGGLEQFELIETIPRKFARGCDYLRVSEPDRYLGPWLAELTEMAAPERPVRAVLGYCAGAALARALADAATKYGLGEPILLLFDPLRVNGTTLSREFAEALDTVRPQLTPGEIEGARNSAARWEERCADAGGRALAPMAEALDEVYQGLVTAACGRLRVAPALERQLCDRFASYFAYLVASSRCEETAAGPVAEVVWSNTREAVPHAGDRAVRFDVPEPQLLADAAVAEFVSQTLRR